MARICNSEYVCIAVPSFEPDTSLIHTDYLPRERVTRCRDCRYHAGTFCKLHEVMMPDPSEDDGFCAWGSTGEGES